MYLEELFDKRNKDSGCILDMSIGMISLLCRWNKQADGPTYGLTLVLCKGADMQGGLRRLS